jgi:hypothetical protein
MRPVPVPMSISRPIGVTAKQLQPWRLPLRFPQHGASGCIPLLGMVRKIAFGGRARSARTAASRAQYRPQPNGLRRIGHCHHRWLQRCSVLLRAAPARGKPSCLPCGVDGKPGIAQDLHMAGNARLALPQHLRKFPNRQAPLPAQKRDDSQPGRVGKGAENVEGVWTYRHTYKEFFISVMQSSWRFCDQVLTVLRRAALSFENPVAKWNMNR